MDDIIEQIKQKSRIEQVIEETGFSLNPQRGKYIHGREHDSLVINVVEQFYVWNSQGETGDVFTWLQRRKNWDFKTAAEWLANRAKLPSPEWSKEDNTARLAARATEDALTVAARWFVKRLRKEVTAIEYCHNRGWSDKTIQESGLGYSGDGLPEDRKDLEGDLDLNGVERGSPIRKAVLGIPIGMLIYPHVYRGRVRYLSCRSIEGKKHYNLPFDLAGKRQVFFNHLYSGNDQQILIVEGQADAITLAQWGIAAVALAGTVISDHKWLFEELRKAQDKKKVDIYLGFDQDEAGMNALRGKDNDWPLAVLLGPMTWIVTWPGKKDANDWLQAMIKEGITEHDQLKEVKEVFESASPLVLKVARWAGGLKGPDQDRGFARFFEIAGQMPSMLVEKYKETMVNVLGIGVRDFKNMLREAQGKKGDEERPAEIVEVMGGTFGGYLFEYLYDEESGDALLAYRDPDGKVDTAKFLDIEGVRYMPKAPNSLIRTKGILFPSKVGQLKSTRELVAIVESFINQHYLLDDRFFGRMAAYYVLLTWLYDCFNAIPYLRATGDTGAGKSQLMIRIGHVCYRMMSTGGAGSAASLFRALEEYKGTAFMDEMDLQDGGDMANELVKILNLGAMKGNPVWRLDQVNREDGTKSYEVAAYDIFGPKLIAMRKEFRDQAVASRCLTIKLMAKEPLELKMAGVSLHLDEEFYAQALGIRNLLLRWRLEKWKSEIVASEELMDLEVPARLNQVTMPLKAIAQDDPELMKDITTFVRGLNEELILERSMGLDARVMDALVAIREDAKYAHFLFNGVVNGMGTVTYCYTKHVTEVCNVIIDEMNVEEKEDDEGKKRKTKGTTSHTVGKIARQTLQLPSRRMANGYVIIYNDNRMTALKVKYGIK